MPELFTPATEVAEIAADNTTALFDHDAPTTFTCRVVGIPVPQGSSRGFVVPHAAGKRGFRAVVTSDNKKLRPWRQEMRSAFEEAFTRIWERSGDSGPRGWLFSSAVEVSATFIFPRLAWHDQQKKPRQKPHTTKPDLDKLLRALADALTESCVLRDDALITDYGRLKKRYAEIGESPGVMVIVKAA
jgi:hypothetical protein